MTKRRLKKAVTRTIDLVLLVLLVLDRGKIKCCRIGENQTSWFEIPVSRQKDSIEHRFIK